MARSSLLAAVVVLLAVVPPVHAGDPGVPVAGLGEVGTSKCFDLPATPSAECGRNPPTDVAVTPDGRHAYAVTDRGDALYVLRRSAAGPLRPVAGVEGCIAQSGAAAGCRDGRGLRGAMDVRLSGDGLSLYVGGYVAEPEPNRGDRPGPSSSTIAVFRVDRSTGALAQLPGAEGCVAVGGSDGGGNSCTAVRGVSRLGPPRPSADGRSVYATSGAVAVFARDAATGALAQLPDSDGCVVPAPADAASGCGEARGIELADDAAVSGDGRHVYLSNAVGIHLEGRGGVAAFARDESTGAIRQLAGAAACYAGDGRAGCTVVPDRADGTSVALSPDGAHLYLLGGYGYAIYKRDVATGALTYTACISSDAELRDCTSIGGQLAPYGGLTFAPDGLTAYAIGQDSDDGILTLARDPASGRLVEVACTVDGVRKRCLEATDISTISLDVAFDGSVVAITGSHVTVLRAGLALPQGPLAVNRRGTAYGRIRCDSRVGRCVGRLAVVGGDPYEGDTTTFASARYSLGRGRSATVPLRFTRAGRSEVKLKRSAIYGLTARTRTGGAVVTTSDSVRIKAPPGGFAPDRDPDRPARCLPPGAQNLARSSNARLYRRRASEGVIHVYGCLNAIGRGFPLEDFDDLDNGHHFGTPYALAGRYVAYPDHYVYEYAAEPGTSYTAVTVVDLATGKTVREGCVEPAYCDGGVDDIVLAPSAAVAWIAERRVWRMSGARRKPERVGGGRGLKTDSLKLRGGRVTWVQGGRTRSAALR